MPRRLPLRLLDQRGGQLPCICAPRCFVTHVALPAAEIERRLAALPERPIPYSRGALAKYARLVSSASRGAITH